MATGNKIGYAMPSLGALTDVDASQRNMLGQRAFDDKGNEYVYLLGVASTAAGDWVSYVPNTWATTRLVANTAATGLIAVAMAATVAGNYGWYQIYGLTPAFTAIATDASADGKSLSMGASGADGRVLTGPTTTKNIFGAVAVGAAAANTGTAAIAYPFMFGTATI